VKICATSKWLFLKTQLILVFLFRIYRVAIMKNGEIKDQGNLLSLKSKYQNGYKLIIKMNSGAGDTAVIKNFLNLKLDAVLQEEYAVNETIVLVKRICLYVIIF
jgi:ABC-type uncharacterized transport system ATPase subunit